MGEMSQLNVYDEVVLPSVVAELANKTSCNMASVGNVVAWTDMLDHTLGDVRVVNESHCLGKYHQSDDDRLRTELAVTYVISMHGGILGVTPLVQR